MHKALADPLRIRLLELVAEAPRSARELADCAGLPADRLYYHLAQLEQAKLIQERISQLSAAAQRLSRVAPPYLSTPVPDKN